MATATLKKKLEKFVTGYQNGDEDEHLVNYRTGSSSRTTGKSSRDLRVIALGHWLAK